MGDRTHVTLTILKEHLELVRQFVDQDPDTIDEGDTIVVLNYAEVNYGTLDFLPQLLEEGIPYTSAWDRGYEYDAGEETCRFLADGTVELKSIYETQTGPYLQALLALIDKPDELRKLILDYAQSQKIEPWETQEANRKMFLMKKLIGA